MKRIDQHAFLDTWEIICNKKRRQQFIDSSENTKKIMNSKFMCNQKESSDYQKNENKNIRLGLHT